MMSVSTPAEIRLTRWFDASPERVFDACPDPAQARAFLFATPQGEMLRVEIDARVGGTFYVVERRHGQDAEHFGQYLDIDRPHRLVFIFSTDKDLSSGVAVSITIAAQTGGCELTLRHEIQPEWAEYAERTKQGWSTMLDTLAAFLA